MACAEPSPQLRGPRAWAVPASAGHRVPAAPARPFPPLTSVSPPLNSRRWGQVSKGLSSWDCDVLPRRQTELGGRRAGRRGSVPGPPAQPTASRRASSGSAGQRVSEAACLQGGEARHVCGARDLCLALCGGIDVRHVCPPGIVAGPVNVGLSFSCHSDRRRPEREASHQDNPGRGCGPTAPPFLLPGS